MAKFLADAQVAVLLARGTFDDLIGTLEAEHLECKARPYQLQHDYQKFELAKDVSMIANWLARHGGEGAHLLLGVRTEKSAERHADEVTAVSPFPQSLVDPKQYYDVLQSWLLPPPEGLRVEWCRPAEDGARGIVAITIPRQPADRWPCLITKVLETSGKVEGRSIGYVERRGEHGVEWTAPDFQRLLREGARGETFTADRGTVPVLRWLRGRGPEVVAGVSRAATGSISGTAALPGPARPRSHRGRSPRPARVCPDGRASRHRRDPAPVPRPRATNGTCIPRRLLPGAWSSRWMWLGCGS